jgi:hypothetical protein
MQTILNFSFFVLSLGLIEAVVKPMAKRFVQRKILKIAPTLLLAMDRVLPELIECSDSDELERKVRKMAEDLTGEDWGDTNLDPLFELYDLRKAISNKYNGK